MIMQGKWLKLGLNLSELYIYLKKKLKQDCVIVLIRSSENLLFVKRNKKSMFSKFVFIYFNDT